MCGCIDFVVMFGVLKDVFEELCNCFENGGNIIGLLIGYNEFDVMIVGL